MLGARSEEPKSELSTARGKTESSQSMQDDVKLPITPSEVTSTDTHRSQDPDQGTTDSSRISERTATEWKEVEEGRFTDVSLERIRQMQSKWSTDRGFTPKNTPRNLLLAMTGELGEVAEIFMWKGEVERGCPDFTDREKEHLGEELADVLIYLTRLADVCDVDLTAAALRKIKLNSIKYPVDGSGKQLR